MYYASFGILAVIHHLILNYDVLKNGKKDPSARTRFRYRQFLLAILIFYLADLLWGFFMDLKLRPLVYADTMLFFATMAVSVLLWTRYVVAFLDKKGLRSTSFMAAGWGIYTFVILLLILNFFYPVIFSLSETSEYSPAFGRYILLVLQFLLFTLISGYSLFVSYKSTGREKVHYGAVCFSGAAMAAFIVFQNFFPFAPFYTIGCMLANTIIHVFVEEDEKREQYRLTAVAQKEKEQYSQIAASLATEYEAIYYIEIETGKYVEISTSDSYKSMHVPTQGENFYKETRENAKKYVHPDDRAFAESMYHKGTMKKNLETHRSYSYKYRVMIGGEARFFQFDVMLSEDGAHFVLCDKDIQDTITAETALLEKQKISVTYSQIAESLASNYDVIYYIDIETQDYVGYTSKNIYGELKVDESGSKFFLEAKKNSALLVHPQDRERMYTVMDQDYLLTALEGRKEFIYEYRLIVNNETQHTRLSARKSSDGRHIIIGVENVEAEVKKEREHLRALNTEKELARRDELTGVRNKTAFSELEQSVQSNIESGMNYLPFAIAICDLNDLKKINDTMGHKAGDEYIRTSAELLCEIFDHSPVFRIGGDEFAIFLSGDDYAARNQLIHKLHQVALSNRDRHDGPVIAVGMAEYNPVSDSNVTDIFDRADRLMYADKRELKQIAV